MSRPGTWGHWVEQAQLRQARNVKKDVARMRFGGPTMLGVCAAQPRGSIVAKVLHPVARRVSKGPVVGEVRRG